MTFGKVSSGSNFLTLNRVFCPFQHLAAAAAAAAAAAKSLQSCPTLCNLRDGSPPGSPVPGILQARTLEWVAISFSNARKWKVKVKLLCRVQLLVTPWIAAYQALPSMGFSKPVEWGAIAFSERKWIPPKLNRWSKRSSQRKVYNNKCVH